MKRVGQIVRAVLTVAAIACLLGGGAAASTAARKPTLKEREAITAALPAWLRRYPVGCVWLDISVSNNGRFAKVAPAFLNATRPPCLRYASNGIWILKRSAKWKIIFNGSVLPQCSLHVPGDLTRCRR
jgi:hypothetical protein